MAVIIASVISNPDFDSHLENYIKDERAHANRVVLTLFNTKLQFPQIK